jgi:hypothetical protein
MSEITGVVANLKREQKALKKRLRTIGKALRNLRGLDALLGDARNAFERGRKKYRYHHDARARKLISASQKARWKKLKAEKAKTWFVSTLSPPLALLLLLRASKWSK